MYMYIHRERETQIYKYHIERQHGNKASLSVPELSKLGEHVIVL